MRKIITVLLAVILCLGVFPYSALADDNYFSKEQRFRTDTGAYTDTGIKFG